MLRLPFEPLCTDLLAKREVAVNNRVVRFGFRIECARAAPEMYSGFGVPMHLSEMDVDGAFAEFAQKKPGEIQSNSNHCLKFVLIVESSKTMLSCRRRWRIQSAQMYPRQCSGCKLTHTMRAQVQECNNGTKANVPIHFSHVHSQSCNQHFDISSLRYSKIIGV